ncbi:MAG: GNAT family N-acetyltransferase [Anaerolineae bacterium]
MKIVEIQCEKTIDIRHKVMWPGKPREFCHVDGDDSALHFGAFVESKLVSVASLFLDETSGRLRKFATLETFQRQGIGSQMLEHVIQEAQKRGIRYFWCDARESAVAFYGRFGLTVEGNRFFKAEQPYFKMSKCLH